MSRGTGSGRGIGTESGRGTGSGRGLGRAVGRGVFTPPSQLMLSEIRGSTSSGDEVEYATRSRGGVRTLSQLITKPANIKITQGSGGTDIDLRANYFRLVVPEKEPVYQYHVDFEPEIDCSQVRRGLLLNEKERFGSAYVFDGMSNLKTQSNIPTPLTFSVTRDFDRSEIEITIRQTGIVSFGSFEMLHFYNTQMRRNLRHTGLIQIGRYYYEPNTFVRLTEHQGVTILKGYLTAINQHDSGLLLAVDGLYKFIRDDTAYTVLSKERQKGGNWKEEARKALIGRVIITKYNNKTYKLDDIDFSTNPNSSFERKGQKVTYKDYYEIQYKMKIFDAQQPMLVCMPTERNLRFDSESKPIRLVPELCNLTGLTDEMKTDHLFMQRLATVSRLAPAQRVEKLKTFHRNVTNNDLVKEEMGKWNISIDDNLVSVKGRKYPLEEIVMGNDYREIPKTTEFSSIVRNNHLYKRHTFDRWAICLLVKDWDTIEEFRNAITRISHPMGILLEPPKLVKVETDRPGAYIMALKSVPESAKFVVILVPNNNKERYDAIKKFCLVESPIHSQVITTRALRKKGGMMAVVTKILIQMACKAGGIPWSINIPPKDIMFAGYDAFHDSNGKGASVGGFVCSINSTISAYHSRVTFHHNREEMSSNLAFCMQMAIKAYKTVNGSLPKRIIFYRDGVGLGMIRYVFEREVVAINNCLAQFGDIKLSFTIVTKRTNCRFFTLSSQNTVINPPPGTVVDNTVTRVERYDFYLISQSVHEGTVTPTLYDIIYDTSGWLPTNHQQIAYKLTYLYFNWSGTVKVPAPVQYAHKLALLCGKSLHTEPSPRLSNSLYFL